MSWLLQTSPCESINSVAWRYSPKEYYYIRYDCSLSLTRKNKFNRSGHELRTKLAVVHWNHLKLTAMDGSRPVVSMEIKCPTKNKLFSCGTQKIREPHPQEDWLEAGEEVRKSHLERRNKSSHGEGE